MQTILKEDNADIMEDLKDERVVAGLLDAIHLLWLLKSSQIGKPEHKDYRKALEPKAAQIVGALFKHYKVRLFL